MKPRVIHYFSLFCALLLAGVGCASRPSNAARHVLSIHNYDSSRYSELMDCFRQYPGVYQPSLNSLDVQVTLYADPGVTPAALIAQGQKQKFELVSDGHRGSYVAPPGWSQHADVLFLNHNGEDFPVIPLGANKYTVVVFSAEWCKACTLLENELKRLTIKRPDIAVRLIDVGDPGSDAQQHWLPALRSLPTTIFHAPSQQLITAQHGFQPGRIQRTIDAHRDGLPDP